MGRKVLRGLDAGPVKGHVPDIDEGMGGTGEGGDQGQGDRMGTRRRSGGRERWRSGHLGKWQKEVQQLVPTSLSSGLGKEE